MKTLSFINSKLFLLIAVSISLSSLLVNAQDNKVKQKLIKIDQIEEDEYIKGKVTNIDNPEKYKVLVYVHTDKWYIHPYAGQDEGSSWAGIKKDGSWSLSTVKREAKANKIAALIVNVSVAEDAPSSVENIEKIKNNAIVIYTREDMRNKGWYGKI